MQYDKSDWDEDIVHFEDSNKSAVNASFGFTPVFLLWMTPANAFRKSVKIFKSIYNFSNRQNPKVNNKTVPCI